MSSICAVIDFKENPNPEIGRKMNDTMRHRGPDETGEKIFKSVNLFSNRLSVMDIKNGTQPMSAEFLGEKYTILYDGEIYNSPELRREFETRGINFKTSCDTETVLYSYILYGEDCPKFLNGIFSFVIYDESKKEVFIARDRFGAKPLFYAEKDSLFLLASEMKALLEHPKISTNIDKYGLWQLLYLAPVKTSGTGIFKDIKEIPPATCGIYNEDGLRLKKYWRLEAKEFYHTPKEAVFLVNDILSDAIKRRLVSDVPLCTLLSGGLDSSVVSAVASKAYREDKKTLSTYSFEYEGNKESFKQSLFQPQRDDEFAIYMADFISSNHTVLTAPTKDVADYLLRAVKARDLPGQADIDSSLLYFLERIKKNHTVVLSGECADEIFGGYPWFYRPEMLYRDFFPWIHEPTLRIGLFQKSVARADEGYEYISQIYKNSLSECSVLDTDSHVMKASRIATNLSINYFGASLLERKDRCSMASGVEVRMPFTDHRILEFVYNVPWEIKFENKVEKALLRNAMKDFLPDKILNRKKSPYPKTHNPEYEKLVYSMLTNRLKENSPLNEIIDKNVLDAVLKEENHTWFGQLMAKPQLIAWLLQFDFWLEEYKVNIV